MTHPRAAVLLMLMLAVAAPAGAAPAAQLAADKGCSNCHGEPPRRNVRSFAQIAAAYAASRDPASTEKAALRRMHDGTLFSHVAAHERLTEEEAAQLVHWLARGGS